MLLPVPGWPTSESIYWWPWTAFDQPAWNGWAMGGNASQLPITPGGIENFGLIPRIQPNLFHSIAPILVEETKEGVTDLLLKNTALQQKSRRPIKQGSVKGQTSPRKYYLNKNSESNVVNQVFAFVCSFQKSSTLLRKVVEKVGLEEDVISIYYTYASALKKCLTSKYRNKHFLSGICVNSGSASLQAISK